MKTAMQILKENISLSDILSPQTKAVVVAFIDNLLEKEKEQHRKAFIAGMNYADENTRPEDLADFPSFYNQTYNK